MHELFDVFTESGSPLGRMTRAEVHRLGVWHRSSNVFLFRSDGKLIVQRRHANKDVCPGAWDLSVAEHLQADEDYLEAAKRGVLEELGIETVELEAIGGVIRARLEIPEQSVRDYEFQQCFRGITDADINIQPAEVAEYRIFTLQELQASMAASPSDFTPWFRGCAQDVGLFDLQT